MREWNDFLKEQQDLFEEIFNAFPPEYHGFHSIDGLECLSGLTKAIAAERNVDGFNSLSIEEPVTHVFDRMRLLDGLPEGLRVDGTMKFIRSSRDASEPQRRAAWERPAPTDRNDTGHLQQDSLCVISRPEFAEGSLEIIYRVKPWYSGGKALNISSNKSCYSPSVGS